MAKHTIYILVPFILYLAFMLAIGFFFYRRTRNLSHYILGGRGLNRWVTSMSAQASDMSGWLLLGLPGYAYASGLESVWIAAGLIAGTWLNWKFVAARLRVFSESAGNALTLPEYFANRFEVNSRPLRILSAFFILVFFLIYTASGFVAGAKLFSTVFQCPYTVGLVIGILVIISYTFLGGFLAVSWTDFFQGLIMFFAIICVPLLALNAAGGFGKAVVSIRSINPHLLNPFSDTDGHPLSLIAVLSLTGWGIGYFGQPHILARFMAVRKPGELGPARRIAMIWVAVALTGAVAIGLTGTALLGNSLGNEGGETVFMVMVNDLAIPVIAGFLLAAILAAIMSTADSQLLVASSAFTEDLYRVLFRKDARETELMWISRTAVVVIACIAFFISLDPQSSVLGLVAYAWAGFGASFGPLVLLSLYWKRMTCRGALSGIVAGGSTVVIWKQLSGGLFDLYEIIPGCILSLLAIAVTSLLDKNPSPQTIRVFENVSES